MELSLAEPAYKSLRHANITDPTGAVWYTAHAENLIISPQYKESLLDRFGGRIAFLHDKFGSMHGAVVIKMANGFEYSLESYAWNPERTLADRIRSTAWSTQYRFKGLDWSIARPERNKRAVEILDEAGAPVASISRVYQPGERLRDAVLVHTVLIFNDGWADMATATLLAFRHKWNDETSPSSSDVIPS